MISSKKLLLFVYVTKSSSSHSNKMLTSTVSLLYTDGVCVESHISKRTDRKLLDLFDVFNTFYTQ